MATAVPAAANDLVLALLERMYNTLRQATEGLGDEDLYYQPAPEVNSIGWLIWHLSRWKDQSSAFLTGESQVWASQGWGHRFGMDERASGQGDTLEQVAAFRPPRDLLFGYADAAQQVAMERVPRIVADVMDRSFELPQGTRTGWQIFTSMLSDFSQHTGQIAYIRGMLTGRGWMPF